MAIATGRHGFLKENFVVLEPFQPGNTVPFLDQEQHKSPKNTQKNANKWHFSATLAGFFKNDTFFKKPFVRNEIYNEFYYRTRANKGRSILEAAPLRDQAKTQFLCAF